MSQFKIVAVFVVVFNFSFAMAAVDLHKDLVQMNSSVETEKSLSQQPDKKLVYFWASWCTACGEKLTKILPVFAKKRADVIVETVNLDDDQERVTHFIQKQNLKLPVYFDKTGKLKEEQNITAVPHWMTFKKEASGNWVRVASEDAFDLEKIEKTLK